MGIDARPTASPRDRLDRLHIYYVLGRADTRDAGFDNRFIGNWEEDGTSFLFFSTDTTPEVEAFVQSRPELTLVDHFDMAYDEWQPVDHFPILAGGFSIHPAWSGATPDPAGRTLVLDPGVVFGSGCHATTSDCLEALDLAWSGQDLRPKTVIDLGTGTGILSVAAAMLGAEAIVGVDINFLAAQTALRNTRLNRVQDRVLIVKGDATDFAGAPADLLMANIHYDIMKHILAGPGFLRCRRFILSGLLRTPARMVLDQLEKMPVSITKQWNSDGIWYTLLGKVISG
ncbi:50S ribosomal protein L11 methyltransferase [Desulfosudis oleivorans]|uniref:Ribosomal L11 methyltransferase n=1 Tax=Desulfosudis oleivorans (strain DSM 6200 / JCM 39069 / Hxd3) TaxID=96561 RepID=A8ZZD8_DESOH|nr:50S ribosomal protein L11 methyltransferase [Desulfosudis oleivorans]ABW67291.1 ribosomal L11 methyltransferase [Desulfosudis oleivorans Hxd3]